MSHPIAGPDVAAVVPPLLACLSMAFVSPQPSATLLSLLSSVLRQRIQLLSGSSEKDSWLSLLCWDQDGTARLIALFKRSSLEPHPASGEVEYSVQGPTRFRYVDPETLLARVTVTAPDLPFIVFYVWTLLDDGSSDWKVIELQAPPPDRVKIDLSGWSTHLPEPETALSRPPTASSRTKPALSRRSTLTAASITPAGALGGDTSYRAPSPATDPTQASIITPSGEGPTTAVDTYYSQYTMVLPSLDGPQVSSQMGPVHHLSSGYLTTPDDASMTDVSHSRPPAVVGGDGSNATGNLQSSSLSRRSSSNPSLTGLKRGLAWDDDGVSGSRPASAAQRPFREYLGRNLREMQQLGLALGMSPDDYDMAVKSELASMTVERNIRA